MESVLKERELNKTILDDQFVIFKTLGVGQFAKVKLAEDIITKRKLAIKIWKNNNLNSESLYQFMNEIRILSKCHNIYIVKILNVNINGEKRNRKGNQINHLMYYTMDQNNLNHELFSLIEASGRMKEETAKFIFHKIMSGVKYLHYKGILHRDLKPENILIDTQFQIKISDFGCSKLTSNNNKHLIKSCGKINFGTIQYNAPEIFVQTEYDGEKADLFSCGVLLFVLTLGKFPFRTPSKDDHYYRLFNKSNKTFYWSKFPKVSEEFKDLFENLCNKEINKRFSIDEIFNHEWLKGSHIITEQIKNDLLERFRIFDLNLKSLREKKQIFKMQNNIFEDQELYSINFAKNFDPFGILNKGEPLNDITNNNGLIAYQEECEKINSYLCELNSSMLDSEGIDLKENKIN